MSFDKNFDQNKLTGFFNTANDEKPALTCVPSPSMFENKKPGGSDRIVTVRLTNGLLAQMIEKAPDPYAGTKTPSASLEFGNDRMDNPAPPWMKK
jgi:hypothetical protein